MLFNFRHFSLHVLPVSLTLACGGTALASNLPSAPASISVSANSNGTVVIQWSQSYDSDGWIAKYELLKNNNVIQVGNVTSYTDTNITSGETYHYTVVAIDNNGDRSPASGIASATVSSDSSGGSDDDYLSKLNFPIAVCEDPDGDGWGWDGIKSCKMDISFTTNIEASSCFYVDAKGWGWDGEKSCFVGTSGSDSFSSSASNSISIEICIDTDGDGYGWNGFDTCKP